MSEFIIISGGSSGIGKSLAEFFADREEKVLIIGRNKDSLEEIVNKHPNYINYISGDITKESTLNKIVEFVRSGSHSIKYLIHAAAIIEPIEKIKNLTLDQWNKIQETNVTAPVFLTAKLADKLSDSRVLFFNSNWGGEIAVENFSAYCVSKAALKMAVESLRIELPQIKIAMLNPGGVETKMLSEIRNTKLFDMSNWTIKSPSDIAQYSAWILDSTNDDDFVSEEWNLTLGK